MWGFLIALLSGALMSLQGVLNTEVTKQSGVWLCAVWVQLTALATCALFWLFGDRAPFSSLFQIRPWYLLIGGVLGAVTISYGTGAINGNGVFMIVAGLIGSPVIAMFSGYVIMTLLFILFRNVGRSKVNYISLHIQSLSAAVMAFSHGSNDAQKCMGIITLALLSGGYIGELEVPFLVKIACAFAMCAGTSVGGWRIIRTVGNKIFRLEPVNGLAADINSALTIFTATFLHLPVSTTHVVTGSIMGVGWAKRFRAVHWNVAYSMVGAWVMTIPSTAAVGALVYILIRYIF